MKFVFCFILVIFKLNYTLVSSGELLKILMVPRPHGPVSDLPDLNEVWAYIDYYTNLLSCLI
jgi:hypothetical protein